MNVKVLRKAKKVSRLAWFGTENGKKFSLGCAATFAVGSAAINLLPHSLLLDKYRELFQMYRNSSPVRLTTKIKKQFNDVLDDLKTPEQTRALLKPFTVNGFDVFHAGTTTLLSGAVVGIPINFNDDQAKDIQQSTLLIHSRNVDWNNPDGKNLLDALMLSEDARKFAIGREIVRCQTYEPLLNTFFPLTCVTIGYGLGRTLNNTLNGFSRPFAFRFVLYALTGLFALGNWAFLKDVTTTQYDVMCDKEMSKLGKNYIKGGQEYYSKLLQRNVALRNLMGKEGTKLYSATGNDEFFIRHKRMPIAHRKLYFDEQMTGEASIEEH